MSWAMVALNEVASTPWRNGGGVTRELLAWPHPRDWVIRLSVAEVERNGPFSQFPGVQRWFAVLSGGGVRLRVKGKAHELTARAQPFQFDGGAETACELLAGPTQDFNLMLHRGNANMRRVSGSHVSSSSAGAFVAAYAHAGKTVVRCAGAQLDIPPNTLAWRILDSDSQVELIAEDALWMEMTP
jgi:environmental stress-induced protein Ves